jgi:hypothetical protein
LTDFNAKTHYIKSKKNRKPQFLIEKLKEYAHGLLKGRNSPVLLEDELVFFLGSIFYPKHLKKTFASQPKKKAEIEEIHSSLYKFTQKRLAFLEKYAAYNFLYKDFTSNHKDSLLEQNKTIGKAKKDFIIGFSQIEKRLGHNKIS